MYTTSNYTNIMIPQFGINAIVNKQKNVKISLNCKLILQNKPFLSFLKRYTKWLCFLYTFYNLSFVASFFCVEIQHNIDYVVSVVIYGCFFDKARDYIINRIFSIRRRCSVPVETI